MRLACRFALPLALWFTVGQALRYALLLGDYHYGMHNGVVPILVISLIVMVTLAVTVAMVHSVKDGLAAVRERDLDESLAPWAAREEETIRGALTRALLPFMIFYLAWNWFSDDAKSLEQAVASRGDAQGGIMGQLTAMKSITALSDHFYVAIALTAGFLVLKFVAERVVEPRWSRAGGVAVAYCEVNWTLFGVFTVNRARDAATGWIQGRVAWGWLGHLSGPVLGWAGSLWPSFKDAVLGALVWLVIAGVILGVDADEEAALGKGRFGRRIVAASGIDRPRTPREVMTRELRDKWLPMVYGFRMVFRAGILPFAVFCVLFAGLDVGANLAQRGVYDLLGPHPIVWWEPRLTVIGYGVELVHQALRACLLAAAFNLVVARVSARTVRPRPEPRPSPSGSAAGSPARQS
jgi:hypothetical protein